MSKLFTAALALAIASVLAFATPVFAVAEGQIEAGNIYRIKNLTKNTSLTDPANADACDTVLYNVVAHNPGPGVVVDVRVKATLPSGAANTHTSTVTLSSINANPGSTSDTATLNLSSSQSLSYVSGSTQLLDAAGNVMQTLPDGITQGGVSIGNVRVSVNEKRFVQFKVNISCPPKPEKPVKKVVKPVVKSTVTELPNTGPGTVAGIFAGASAIGAAGHYIVSVRRGRDQ